MLHPSPNQSGLKIRSTVAASPEVNYAPWLCEASCAVLILHLLWTMVTPQSSPPPTTVEAPLGPWCQQDEWVRYSVEEIIQWRSVTWKKWNPIDIKSDTWFHEMTREYLQVRLEKRYRRVQIGLNLTSFNHYKLQDVVWVMKLKNCQCNLYSLKLPVLPWK